MREREREKLVLLPAKFRKENVRQKETHTQEARIGKDIDCITIEGDDHI